jgi:hypothetical protein
MIFAKVWLVYYGHYSTLKEAKIIEKIHFLLKGQGLLFCAYFISTADPPENLKLCCNGF